MKLRHFAATLTFALTLGLSSYVCQAQQLPQAGIVTQASNATDGTSSITVGGTVYSGDLLKTTDIGRLQVQVGTIQFVMGGNSTARIFHDGNRTLVEVARGTMAYSVRGTNENLVFYAQDMKIVPRTLAAAAGQIDISNQCSILVTSTRSAIDVTTGKETRTIEESKSFRVTSEVGVDYRDNWQPVLSDYPDFPREADYHHSHGHVACPAAYANQAQRGPVSAIGSGHFVEVIGGVAAIITTIIVHKAFESPDHP